MSSPSFLKGARSAMRVPSGLSRRVLTISWVPSRFGRFTFVHSSMRRDLSDSVVCERGFPFLEYTASLSTVRHVPSGVTASAP